MVIIHLPEFYLALVLAIFAVLMIDQIYGLILMALWHRPLPTVNMAYVAGRSSCIVYIGRVSLVPTIKNKSFLRKIQWLSVS